MSQKQDKPVVWVLLSGGIDSAACAAFCLGQNWHVRAIHVNYGQASARRENIAADAVAKHFGIPHTTFVWSGGLPKESGEIAGRNAFLIFAALMEIGNQHGLMALGLHSGTPYYDCSESFLSAAQILLDGCTNGRIKVIAPFLTWSKRDIWDFCVAHEVPLDLAYSCEQGSDKPCGECLSCRDRRALDAVSNFDNSTQAVRSKP